VRRLSIFLFLFGFIIASAIGIFPQKAAALESQQIGWILEASQAKHLSEAHWCMTTTANKAWPTSVKSCDTGGGKLSTFDEKTSSYVMFENLQSVLSNPDYTPSNGQPQYLKQNRFTMYVAQPNKKLTFWSTTDALGGKQYYLTSTDVISVVNVTAEPNTDPDFKYNWRGSYANNQFSTGTSTPINPATVNGGRGIVIGNDRFASAVGTNNVEYSNSWDMGHFTQGVPYGTDGKDGCGTLDIACWVRSITSGFTQGIKELFGLFIDAIKWLFVPDSDQLNNAWEEFSDFMEAKLGFLAYPFTFFSNVFNAFDSGSSWCNSSSCVKNFGNLMGRNFTVNLGQTQTNMPTIWNWFTGMIRGLTVVALLLAVRGKYRQVTNK